MMKGPVVNKISCGSRCGKEDVPCMELGTPRDDPRRRQRDATEHDDDTNPQKKTTRSVSVKKEIGEDE